MTSTAAQSEPIPFALPDVGEDEIEAVVAALRSGWLSSGPRVREFERAFEDTIDDDVEAVSVNSATAGLHLALEALGIGPGDEVLVPSWTFTATAEVVRYLGAEPVFVDVCASTLNMDLADAEGRVSERTKAVLPVHFAGLVMDPGEVNEFAQQHSLKVVEDAAHALSAERAGQRVGSSTSEATVFSFYATKTMTTGEGGMIVTRNHELARRTRTMRLHGIDRDVFDRYRSSSPSWRYDVVAPGYKYNLTDPAAAMGLVQLAKAGRMRDRRAEIAHRYTQAFAELEIDAPTSPPADAVHAWHLYVVRLPDEARRDEFISALGRAGIGTSVHFIPLHLQPYWRDRGNLAPHDYPVATREFERVVSLPIYSSMSDGQVDRVVAAVQDALAE